MQESLIINAYNESSQLIETLEKVPKDISQIIVIDDCSTNDTYTLAKKYAEKDNRVLVLRNSKNSGKGYSMRQAVKKAKYKKLVFMDATQFDPAEVPFFVSKLQNSVMIIGQRDFSKVPFLRQVSNLFAKSVFFLATFNWIKDPMCGFRAIMKSDFEKLYTKEDRYAIECEICYNAVKNKMKINYVPISVHYNAPSSIIKTGGVFNVLRFLIKAVFRMI